MYDVTRKETFEHLDIWLREIEQFSQSGGKDLIKLLVGNKIDQPRVVTRDEAEDFAKSRGMLFMESSAKTNEGVFQVFNEIIFKVNSKIIYISLYKYNLK